MRGLACAVIASWVCAGCGDNLAGEDRQGGATTVDDRTSAAFTHPATNLTTDELATFQLGLAPFDFTWEVPQLGPQFNNSACVGCHGSNGRGLSQINHDVFGSQALVRVSMPTGVPGVPGGPVPVPVFGTQLQDHATIGLPEAFIDLSWVEHDESFGDGEAITLRAPDVVVSQPNGDPFPSGMLTSYRQAPAVVGLGLLEAIPDATLLALADPDDVDGDGISGRVNMVWNPILQTTVVGRFGHKASVPTVQLQAAGAFANDMGLSNKLDPDPDGMSDVQDDQLDGVVFFASTIAVPAAAPRDATAIRGRELFESFGCVSCHVPTLETGDHPIPELAHQTIHPYTDLLLHDLGPLLADGRPDFLAQGFEWRTPPLWGLGLVQVVNPMATFLHDGRARTLEEAIVWHGGEAMAAREAFRLAAKQDRDALIAFLATL